jgi:3-deoxy-D-manno-octulosonic-acid transferase
MARKLRRRGASEPGYLQHTGERFGRYEGAAPAPGSIWVHAVSLGETRAAAVLIAALRETRPGCRILLTHGTATGRAEGVALLREGDAQAWLPWDMPQAVEAFLQHFRPAHGRADGDRSLAGAGGGAAAPMACRWCWPMRG